MKIFVGISGASGSIYGGRLLEVLKESGIEITTCISDGALEVMGHEEKLVAGPKAGIAADTLTGSDTGFAARREAVTAAFLERHGIGSGEIELAQPRDMASTFASGSSLADAAIVCPCSMSTLASIASGVTRNLIHRVADVMLKESRPLALVPRETPLSEIHLRNMLRVKRAGALLIPAMPGFYHHPESVDDIVDFVVGKVLDSLGIKNELFKRWQGS
ncbi:MAG: UbiX family flavin prenyltransferase [Thermoleophilia bacterium]|nr:UbiX family flavin prenyltransferase [Thermoleophilia bacterium]